jgi:glycosyltransferase involved in cell wall biosynthesis
VRVLIVDHTGGIRPFRRKFAAIASQPDVELTVFAPSRWVENYRVVRAEPGEADGYRLLTGSVVWPGYENRGLFVSGLGRAFRVARPDLLHLWEEPFSLISLEALLVARLRAPRARVIFSSSDDWSRGFRYPYRPSWLYARIERFTLRRSDGATVMNEAVRSLLREKGFDRPLELITHGLDLRAYLQPSRGSPGPPRSGKPVVGYLGRLTPQKGVDVLLRAFRRVATRSVPAAPELRIVGEGPERRRLEGLAGQLGIGEAVRFLPAVPHAEAPSVLAGIDVLVLPSRTVPKSREHFGRVLIEGMAAGCVVIGTDSGAIPEVLADAGIVVPEEDDEAMADAIARALEHPAMAEALRTKGRERVRERYTWEAIAARLGAFYRRILSERGRSGGG